MLWLFITLLTAQAQAVNIYGSCIKAYDFGVGGISEIVVHPLNKSCVNGCAQACKAFSYFDGESEINGNIINDCITSCQGGVDFTSRFYNAYDDDSKKYLLGGLATATSPCKDMAVTKNSAVKTSLSGLIQGNKVKLTPATGVQRVHLCGSKSLSVEPVFNGILQGNVQNDWSTTAFRNSIINRKTHPCLVGISDETWANLTSPSTVNYDYLLNLYNAPRANPETAEKEAATCLWNARSANFYDTGIYAADGDDLSISWEGDYGHRGSPYGDIYQNRQISLLCMQQFCGNNGDTSNCNTCRQYWQDNSVILLKSFAADDQNLSPSGDEPIALRGESARSTPLEIDTFGCKTSFTGGELYGLTSGVEDRNLVIDLEQQPQNSCEIKVTNAGNGYYSLTGTLSGLTSDRRLLAFRHFDQFNPDTNGQAVWYNDNIGGYKFNINWRGCPRSNGQNLQYTISSVYNEVIPDQFWQDVPSEVFLSGKALKIDLPTYIGNGTTDASELGTLYFRIKPMQAPASANPTVNDLYQNPAHYRGSYTINVTQSDVISTSNGPLQKLVKEIGNTLLGYDITSPDAKMPANGGAIGVLYRNVITQTHFINIVTTLLTLYIALTGTSYIIGIAKINQQDGLIRILKVALVITLISEQSWQLFSTYLVDFFVIGTLHLIGIVSIDVIDVLQNQTAPTVSTLNAFSIFRAFDFAISMFTSEKFWLKSFTVSIGGGFLLPIIIIISTVYYFLALLRATVIFIYSLVMISILLVLSSIFIPLILFQNTKNIFDSWWKSLLSFMLQPMMVFTSISLFHFLILTVIYTMLSVTICPVDCAFSFFGQCKLNIYRPIGALHEDYGFSHESVGNLLTSSMILLLLSYTMLQSITFFTDLAARIVSGFQNRLTSMGLGAEKAVKTPIKIWQSGAQTASSTKRYASSIQSSFNKGYN